MRRMAFVPEGQADRSQAQSACTCLASVIWPEGTYPFSEAVCTPKGLAVWTFENRFSLRPGGTRDSSPAIYRRVGRP
jgi:hypothetical protein